MQAAFLIGRIILGAYYLLGAINHFVALGPMTGYAEAKGVPFPAVAVVVAGVLLGIAGITFLLGWHPKVGVAALVLFFVPVTLMMHAFWRLDDPAMRMADMVNFMKNFALLASGLMFLAIPEPWPVSIDARTRTRMREPVPA